MANKLPSQIFDLNDLTTSSRSVSVLYGRKSDGSLIALDVDDNGILSSNATVVITGSDIKIGAVEIEDKTSGLRACVINDQALTPAPSILTTEHGSSNHFFSDDTTNAVDDTAFVDLAVGFNTRSVTIINDDSTKDLLVSFTTVTHPIHAKLKPGDGQTFDSMEVNNISLQSAAVGVILYRTWAH